MAAALLGVAVGLWAAARLVRPEPHPACSHAAGPVVSSAGSSRGPTLSPEFLPQKALILSCRDLAGGHASVFTGIVAAVHRSLQVIALTSDASQRDLAEGLLESAGLPPAVVHFVEMPLDTMWARDYGPLFLRGADGSVILGDLDYSSQDGRLPPRPDDNRVPRRLAEKLGLPVVSVPLRVSGGNLLNNGDGLCVTTAAVIRTNRDRGYDEAAIRRVLCGQLGFTEWLCVPELAGEPTGDADVFVTFLAPDVAVVARCDWWLHAANARILDQAARALAKVNTSRGPMQVHRIPMPPPRNGAWRSYTNIVLANDVVLVPVFPDVEPAIQQQALDLYARLLPGRRIVGIRADGLSRRSGLLHCICLNVPGFVPVERLLAPPAGP